MKRRRHVTVLATLLVVSLGLITFLGNVSFAAEKVTIEVAVGMTKVRFKRYEEWKELVERKYPNIEIKYVELVGPVTETTRKLAILIAGGKAPHIVRNPMMKFAGLMVDLRPLIDRDRYDMTDFYPRGIEAAQYRPDGSFDPTVNFGLPANLSSTLFVFNKTLFDEAGLPYPPADWDDKTWTHEVLLETAKKLTKDIDGDGKIDQYGVQATFPHMGVQSGYMAWSVGMDLLNEDRTKAIVDDPKIVEAFQYWVDLVIKHKVSPPPAATREWIAQGIRFQAGKVAMSVFGTWNIGEYQKNIKDFEWDVAVNPLPTVDYKRVQNFGPNLFTILKGTGHLDEAWEVLKIFVGPEAMKSAARNEGRPPSRKSLADFYIELNTGKPPSRIQTVVNAPLYGHLGLMFYEPRFPQVHNIMQTALDLMMWENKSAAEALKSAKIKIDKMLEATK